MKRKHLVLGLALLCLAAVLAACGGGGPPATEPPPAATEAAAAPTQVSCPEAPACPTPVVQEVPFQDQWAASGHAQADAEPFTHWNEESPAEIPTNCAKCHSTPGYQDFVGADGSAFGVVDKAAPIGTVITCVACHNAGTATMTSVTFPSGAEISGLGPEARCMQCHQGRASKVQVDESITEAGLDANLDQVSADLGFVNIHYYAAAASLYGTQVKGGYEYEGKQYDAKFDHVAGYNTCVGCHSSHSLEVKVDQCQACHTNVSSQEDLRTIRMQGSLVDYNGNGDTAEGIDAEIKGLQAMLLQAIQAYGKEVSGTAIAYNEAAHPYFFIDTNEDGQAGEDESNSDNRYNAFTARLLRAAYNYQTSLKDPGAFAHGGKYMIELLYDSIEDLNTALSTPVDLAAAHRTDAGHFASSEEAFRHWDEDGLVPGECAKCHSATGLPTFLDEASRARDGVTGNNIAVHPSSGLNCATCHNDLASFTRFEVTQVKFPSGSILSFPDSADSNVCMACHQGRESKTSMDRAIAASDLGPDEVASEDKALAFRNPHYFATASTLFGTEAKGAYEIDGQSYNGRFTHTQAFDTCIECHEPHALTVNVEGCAGCHGTAGVEDLQNIRMEQTPVDYDGDGDTTEGIAGEVAGMQEALYAALQAYAADTAGTALVYSDTAYPYFFADANANGTIDEGEGAFTAWTPNLLRGAYNYQWVSKDPGAFAHNGKYILQVLYDSLQVVGGDVGAMTRPEVKAPAAAATPTP